MKIYYYHYIRKIINNSLNQKIMLDFLEISDIINIIGKKLTIKTFCSIYKEIIPYKADKLPKFGVI